MSWPPWDLHNCGPCFGTMLCCSSFLVPMDAFQDICWCVDVLVLGCHMYAHTLTRGQRSAQRGRRTTSGWSSWRRAHAAQMYLSAT